MKVWADLINLISSNIIAKPDMVFESDSAEFIFVWTQERGEALKVKRFSVTFSCICLMNFFFACICFEMTFEECSDDVGERDRSHAKGKRTKLIL